MAEVNWGGIPEDFDVNNYEGFVYIITNKDNDKKYIGRKYFFNNRRIKVKGRKSRKLVVTESDWRKYKSSSRLLKKDMDIYGIERFEFEILSLHETRGQTNYAEVKEQFTRDVLYAKLPSGEKEYYNGNILSRYFSPSEEGTQEYKDRCSNISKALKRKYENGELIHPMLGKDHPNKGKKMPQTGQSAAKGKIAWNNGETSIFIHKNETPPEGYKRGLFREVCSNKKRSKRLRMEYDKSPKNCAVCNGIIPYEGRTNSSCSQECGFRLVVINRKPNTGKDNPMWKHHYNTPKGKFVSAKDAGIANGCSDVTVRNRCKSDKEHFNDWFLSKE